MFIVKRIILLLSILYLTLNASNLGHRLGGDIYKPENTLYSYKKALKSLQNKKEFTNIEFDIRETKDKKLVVFHDRKIGRVVPESKFNRAILNEILKKKKFKSIRIDDLNLKTILKLRLKNSAKIPTLDEVLDASIKWKLKKDMHIEIKFLKSDEARYRLIETVLAYTSKINITCMAFRKNFYQSFPFTQRWIDLFQRNNLKFYQIDRYEFTKSRFFRKRSSTFATLLPETSFYIKKPKKRVEKFSFFLPENIKAKDRLKIGIYGGSDNSGDEGVTFRVENNKGEVLISGFSNADSWEWFNLYSLKSRELILVIEDYDTNLKGKYPGNGGIVKVLFVQGN